MRGALCGVCTNFNFLFVAVTPFTFDAAGFAVLDSVITGELITTQKKLIPDRRSFYYCDGNATNT